jgi:hypothetical protein
MSYGFTSTAPRSNSGKATENQNSLFVVAGRDKLVGYKIHSIMQGRDQTNVCSSVVTFNLGVTMLPFQEDDGPPLTRPKAPVDSFGLSFYFGEESLWAGASSRPAG